TRSFRISRNRRAPPAPPETPDAFRRGCRPLPPKPPLGGLEGRSPPKTIRTRRHARRVRKPCAARFPCTFPRPRPQAQGKRVLAEKAGAAGLFRQAGAAASRFRYHVPAVRFAQRRTLPACKA